MTTKKTEMKEERKYDKLAVASFVLSLVSLLIIVYFFAIPPGRLIFIVYLLFSVLSLTSGIISLITIKSLSTKADKQEAISKTKLSEAYPIRIGSKNNKNRRGDVFAMVGIIISLLIIISHI